jgi:hypothetical protein
VLNPFQILGIQGVEAGAMGVRSGRDQQIECTSAGTPAVLGNDSGEFPVARCNGLVDRERVESSIKTGQEPKSASPLHVIGRDQHSKAELSERDCTDRQVAFKLCSSARDERAGGDAAELIQAISRSASTATVCHVTPARRWDGEAATTRDRANLPDGHENGDGRGDR